MSNQSLTFTSCLEERRKCQFHVLSPSWLSRIIANSGYVGNHARRAGAGLKQPCLTVASTKLLESNLSSWREWGNS
eukprot:6461158-Amphidinium_carterae.1